jgi:hypothetical protein
MCRIATFRLSSPHLLIQPSANGQTCRLAAVLVTDSANAGSRPRRLIGCLSGPALPAGSESGRPARAVLAAPQRDFAAELLRFRVAADARDAQHAVHDLHLKHPQRARWPGGVEAGTLLPIAGQHRRRTEKFERSVWMDGGPAVDHLHIGNRLLDEPIEARYRATGVDKVVAAAGGHRARLVFRAVARLKYDEETERFGAGTAFLQD